MSGLAAVLGILMAISSSGQAQDQQATASWFVNCSNEVNRERLDCAMSQSVLRANTRQRIVSATINKVDGKDSLLLSLPHGLYVPAGVRINVDDGVEKKIVFETADANGSYANLKIEDDLLQAMKKGNVLNVTVLSRSREQLVLQMSLTGFSSAYKLYNGK